VRVEAFFAVHAEAAQEVVVADGDFWVVIFVCLGVDGEGVVVDDGAAEGVASKLILASFCQAYLALEEYVFACFFPSPCFLAFC
jgi:hypothetical protein